MRALFYLGLFIFVVVVQVGVTTGLRSMGFNPALALGIAGLSVLTFVLGAKFLIDAAQARALARREAERQRQGLPDGPCCVVWRSVVGAQGQEDGMPWELTRPLRVPYPTLARRLGVEGVAILEFEVSAEGVAKRIQCVDAWPSDVFFRASRAALREAKFRHKPNAEPAAGKSYRMPFLFRIDGAAKVKDAGGHHGLQHRPKVIAAAPAQRLTGAANAPALTNHQQI